MDNKPLITFAFWIKAFIPAEVPLGNNQMYTLPVPGQPGKTMIPHPLRMETYAPQDPDSKQDWEKSVINDYGYSTNNRGFSNDENAESKMTTFAKISIFNRMPNDQCVSKLGLGCLQNK